MQKKTELKTGLKTVLVVDDELDMRIFLSTLLETSGYQPVATRNGSEGIVKAREISPDLIILDVMMPGEGGVVMYRQLRTDPNLKTIPVIMLSAVAEKTFSHYLNMINAGLQASIPGPDAYVEKPPEADILVATVARIVGRQREAGVRNIDEGDG